MGEKSRQQQREAALMQLAGPPMSLESMEQQIQQMAQSQAACVARSGSASQSRGVMGQLFPTFDGAKVKEKSRYDTRYDTLPGASNSKLPSLSSRMSNSRGRPRRANPVVSSSKA